MMVERYIESSVGTQVLYIDANNLYVWAKSQALPTGEFNRLTFSDDKIQQLLEQKLTAPDDNDCGYFVRCHAEYAAETKEKTENLHCAHIKHKPAKIVLQIL